MPHPNQSELSLYAGNDLAPLDRLRVEWHLRRCGQCQQDVTEFSEQRAAMRAAMRRDAVNPDMGPGWTRLAAEMKANIRLGLEAGSCIAPEPSGQRKQSASAWKLSAPPRWQWITAGVMGAVLLAGGGVWFDKSVMLDKSVMDQRLLAAHAFRGTDQGVVLAYSENGIQMRDGDDVIGELTNLRRDKRGDVVYSVNSQGGVGASYVDQESGMVTVNNIYYGQ